MSEWKEWVFTFGDGHPNEGKYVRISGTYTEAREEMYRRYGSAWEKQYTVEAWERKKEKEDELV